MTATVRLLDGMLGERSVTGAALFGADRTVEHRGCALPIGELGDVAAAARHVFRETSPAIHVLDLSYASGRVVLLPWGDRVLLLRGEASIDLESILARARDARDEAASAALASPALEPPPAPTPAVIDAGVVLEVLNLIAAEARRTLGGPVIRNYLRRAQKDLSPTYGVLAGFSVDLEGRLSLPEHTTGDATLGRAAGAWARAFLERARVVVPELGALDLRAIGAAHRAALEANGFFDTDRGRATS